MSEVDIFGRIRREFDSYGVDTQYFYDGWGNLLSAITRGGGSDERLEYRLRYDAFGEFVVSETVNGVTRNFESSRPFGLPQSSNLAPDGARTNLLLICVATKQQHRFYKINKKQKKGEKKWKRK